jgi:glycosyltransferase involved in cell wall biosynthesis
MAEPEIAVLVSTYERPGHLRRVLASIAAQRDVSGRFEVVVTDDGSRDETPDVVRHFAAQADYPVHFTTHPHDGFQLTRCRNEGVRASTAPYLLFLDGDCLIPPNHLRVHLDRRRRGYAMAGCYTRVNRVKTLRITEEDVRQGNFQNSIRLKQRLRMRWRHVQALLYALCRNPRRPKLLGGNIGIWRHDYEQVNGYDENFRGWGCEDDDLRLRLRAAGVGVASVSWWTHTYHLWHPKVPSAPKTWREGRNVEYLQRRVRLTRCLDGLQKRRLQDLCVDWIGRRPPRDLADQLLPLWCRVALAGRHRQSARTEIEIAFAPTSGHFSDECDCRVLFIPRGAMAGRELVRRADLIFADGEVPAAAGPTFSLSAFDGVLQRQLGAPRAPAAVSQAA